MLRDAVPTPTANHIERLATLSLQTGGQDVVEFCIGLRNAGLSAERLYLDLLAPTAVLLDDFWAEDRCSFADVTIGVGHLQAAMRVLRPNFLNAEWQAASGAPCALLMPLPGEQHTFGLSMLSAFFVRAGWNTWSGVVADAAELTAKVTRRWIDLVGFSLSHDALLDDARHHIAAVRTFSRNPGLIVMVGGPPFARDLDLAQRIGADATALDGVRAVEQASALLSCRVGSRRPAGSTGTRRS